MTHLLEQHFGQLVDYEFTARMEDDLDRIASGDEERSDWLRASTSARPASGLKALVTDLDEIDARAINTIQIGDGIALRVGRYGPVHRAGRASAPRPGRPRARRADGREGRGAPLAAPSSDRALGVDPEPEPRSSSRTAATAPT